MGSWRLLPKGTVLCLVWLACLCSRVACDDVIVTTSIVLTTTASPTDNNFMGFLINGTSTSPMSAWTKWSTESGFCNVVTENFDYGTTCSDNTVFLSGGSSIACGGMTCTTMSIFQASPGEGPTGLHVDCQSAASMVLTLYREVNASTTVTYTTNAPASTASPASSSAIPASSASTTPSASTAPSATAAPSPSKGWIAGAVIGPMAGVAIVAFAVGWYVRRHKTQQAAAAAAGTQPSAELDTEAAAFKPPATVLAQEPVRYELASDPLMSELPGRQPTLSEAPGDTPLGYSGTTPASREQ